MAYFPINSMEVIKNLYQTHRASGYITESKIILQNVQCSILLKVGNLDYVKSENNFS